MHGDLVKHEAAITEYADTTIFIPELDKEGAEVPPSWFGLNPEEGEDLAEDIASSDEGEEHEDEDGEDIAADDRATSRPQPNQASTSEPWEDAPTAAGADQAKSHQSSTPPTGASASADPPASPAAPLA